MAKLNYLDSLSGKYIEDNSSDKMARIVALQHIPAGSIFVSNAEYPLSRFIGYWGMIRYIKYAIQNHFKIWCSHAGTYWGSGRNEIIEAQGKGVRIANILPYLNDNTGVAVFYNKNVSVPDLQRAKAWNYAQVGKPYDYAAFLDFMLGFLKERKDAFICSELAVEVCDQMNADCLPGRVRSKIHPAEIFRYLISGKGIKAGWRLCYQWNFEREK